MSFYSPQKCTMTLSLPQPISHAPICSDSLWAALPKDVCKLRLFVLPSSRLAANSSAAREAEKAPDQFTGSRAETAQSGFVDRFVPSVLLALHRRGFRLGSTQALERARERSGEERVREREWQRERERERGGEGAPWKERRSGMERATAEGAPAACSAGSPRPSPVPGSPGPSVSSNGPVRRPR